MLLATLLLGVLSQAPVPDEASVLEDLLPNTSVERRQRAFRDVEATADRRYLAPLIDLLRFADTREEWFLVLDGISAVLGEDVTQLERPWYHLTLRLAADRALPFFDGYGTWKGELLAQRVDPAFRRFFAAEAPARIRLDEIAWGGVGVDGIPALVDPRTISVEDARYLDDFDPVFGVSLGGEHRAYPLRILDWHEMANDVVGGVPVSLAYCTLCGAGVLYRAELDGERLEFGSSGLLMRSNKLMYDRSTDTLWNQLTGEPVLGALAERDLRLEVLPVVTTTWAEWKTRHPDTSVLHPSTGHGRDYTLGAAYGSYFGRLRRMFPAHAEGGSGDERAKEQLFLVRSGNTTSAFELDAVTSEGVLNGKLEGEGDAPILLVASGVPEPLPIPAAWVETLARTTGTSPIHFADLTSADLRLLLTREPEAIAQLDDESLLQLSGRVRLELADTIERDGEAPFARLRERLLGGLAIRGLVAEIRAYRRGPHTFRHGDDGFVTDESDVRWRVEETALVSPDGKRLERVPGHLAFRFGWESFF